MSSNSYIRASLGMQSHTNSVLPHNNIDNESFNRHTLHIIRRWVPIQKGLRTDRPTQPETWSRNAARGQEAPTIGHSATMSDWSWLSSKGLATCSTTMPMQKLTRSLIFAENCSTNQLKSSLLLMRSLLEGGFSRFTTLWITLIHI